MLGLGSNLNELKLRIQKAQDELARIGTPESPLPEVINMTNMLRVNEYLTKTDEKKTELISAYGEYTKQLEQIAASLLSIQADLRGMIKTKAAIIGKPSRKKTKKTRKKTKTKKRKKTKTKKRKETKKTRKKAKPKKRKK